MAVDIEAFKSDLEQLKNQRSVIKAKLDEANRHVVELTETLKGMGFNSVDEAKQAYANQLAEAENLHALVKQLILEINQVDSTVPTREDVMKRLSSLETTIQPNNSETAVPQQFNQPNVAVQVQSVSEVPVQQTNDFIQQNLVQPGISSNTDNDGLNTTGDVDLGGMLFASL